MLQKSPYNCFGINSIYVESAEQDRNEESPRHDDAPNRKKTHSSSGIRICMAVLVAVRALLIFAIELLIIEDWIRSQRIVTPPDC